MGVPLQSPLEAGQLGSEAPIQGLPLGACADFLQQGGAAQEAADGRRDKALGGERPGRMRAAVLMCSWARPLGKSTGQEHLMMDLCLPRTSSSAPRYQAQKPERAGHGGACLYPSTREAETGQLQQTVGDQPELQRETLSLSQKTK